MLSSQLYKNTYVTHHSPQQPSPNPQFLASHSTSSITDSPPFGLQSYVPQLQQLMSTYDSPTEDAIAGVRREMDGVREVMVKNIDAVLSRGERIELLVGKTDDLSTNARAFRNRSVALRYVPLPSPASFCPRLMKGKGERCGGRMLGLYL